jgi:hypothetical protein
MNPENATRLFNVSVDDSADQTKGVFYSLADDDRQTVDFEAWQSLQVWLKQANHSVIIPYGRHLADCTQPVAVRMRRDFGGLLSLIKANAILHQENRDTDDQGRIIATLDDYSMVYDLAHHVIAEAVGASVENAMRETILAAEHLIALSDQDPPCCTIQEIADHLDRDRSAVNRQVLKAESKEYLINIQKPRKKPKLLIIGHELPAKQNILPSVDELRACVHDVG